MTLPLKALRSLRWNYTRKGVWFWLKGRQRCRECNATGYVLGPSGDLPLATIGCRVCDAQMFVRDNGEGFPSMRGPMVPRSHAVPPYPRFAPEQPDDQLEEGAS